MGCEAAHQAVAGDHAQDDEEDELERLQDEVEDDAVLQAHLRGPLAVDARQLLIGLNAVIVDRENLAFDTAILNFFEGRWAGAGGGAGFDFGFKAVVL